MTENWKPVVGFEGKYEVSDLGRVRGLDRIIFRVDGRKGANGNIVECHLKGRILKPGLGSHGYPSVVLTGRKTKLVPVLVLTAFRGPAPEGEECCHEDGTRTNSLLLNLRWGTRASNVADMVKHGTKTIGAKFSSSKLTRRDRTRD